MTNEEKANALAKDYLLGHDRANITYEEMLGACLDMARWKDDVIKDIIKKEYSAAMKMAEWKDKQFKEYLEKKSLEISNIKAKLDRVDADYMLYTLKSLFIDEIINELFNKE